MSYIPNLKYKTTICQNWNQYQQCYKGSQCYFAHGEHELRTIQQNRQSISNQNQYLQSVNAQIKMPSNYKTIKCKFYPKGKCQLGSNCTFVHDNSQRRPKPQFYGYNNWVQMQGYNYAFQNPIQFVQTYDSIENIPEKKQQLSQDGDNAYNSSDDQEKKKK